MWFVISSNVAMINHNTSWTDSHCKTCWNIYLYFETHVKIDQIFIVLQEPLIQFPKFHDVVRNTSIFINLAHVSNSIHKRRYKKWIPKDFLSRLGWWHRSWSLWVLYHYAFTSIWHVLLYTHWKVKNFRRGIKHLTNYNNTFYIIPHP